jgi:NDP-sugar pyrophosphorylase family protein
MGDLSKEVPKPMLSLSGKNLLQHKIDRLPKEITEVVLIVHHKKEVIMDYFGEEYNGRKVTYVDQGEPYGTGHALWKAEPVLGEEFISMMGDDVYSEESIKEVLSYPWAMTVSRANSFPGTLDIKTDEEGFVKDVVFDHDGTMGEILLDVCLYKFKRDIFKTPLVQLQNKKEWGLPHTFFKFITDTGAKVKVLKTDKWIKVNSPEDLSEAEKLLKKF